MRRQERVRLKQLCTKYDLDYQLFDYEAYDYQTIKRMILKRAGVETEEIRREEQLEWDSVAELYDHLALEEKMFIPEEMMINPEFPPNILTLQLNRRHLGLALQVLQKFKGNMMTGKDGEPRIERFLDVQGRTNRAIVWFMGRREVTDLIVPELASHNIYPKVLRNFMLRRDFLHYHNGFWYPLSRRAFKELTLQKASRKQERILEKILQTL